MSKYEKGKSGNTSGRPKGIIDKRTQLAKLLVPHAEQLVNKAVEMALTGDVCALRLCIERLIPKASNDTVNIKLPEIDIYNPNLPSEICHATLKLFSGHDISLDQIKSLLPMLKYCSESTRDIANDEELQRAIRLNEEIKKREKERDY